MLWRTQNKVEFIDGQQESDNSNSEILSNGKKSMKNSLSAPKGDIFRHLQRMKEPNTIHTCVSREKHLSFFNVSLSSLQLVARSSLVSSRSASPRQGAGEVYTLD